MSNTLNKNTQKCSQIIPVGIRRDTLTDHPIKIWVSCWQVLSLFMITRCLEKRLVTSF